MSALTLLHPVHTLDKELLLPASTLLSTETLDELIAPQRTTSHKTYSLLLYGSVKKDILEFLSVPPYQRIFSDKEQVDDLLDLMETVQLALPLLQSLDYFRQDDFHTYRHILMVVALSTLLAKDMVPDYQSQIRLAATGPSHDFGKVCVPLNILRKTTPLTRTEQGIIEHHSAAGYVLLSYYLRDAGNIASMVARDHHERKNGSGYPRHIMLTDPVVELIAASDVYDALISPRPYRPVSFDNRTALEEITAMAERNEIGWDVVKAFVAHNRKDKPHYSEGTVSTEKRGTPPPDNVHGIIVEDEDT
jgi:HD-GYP domain-containing protein (c-di-GMP phosphodiesterase class II)